MCFKRIVIEWLSWKVCKTYFICPINSSSGSLSCSSAAIFALTNKNLLQYHCTCPQSHTGSGKHWLRTLMISFPCPICFTTSSSPLVKASFFLVNISLDVSSITSTILWTWRTSTQGLHSRALRRNAELPILTIYGMKCRRRVSLKPTGLLERC